MDEQDSLVTDFLIESIENLDRVDQELLVLEQQPDSGDVVASVFRSIHTIKGTCSFLEFENLEAVTHAGEALLSELRDGGLAMNSSIASALFRMVDVIRVMLASIEEDGSDGEESYEELIEILEGLQREVPAGCGEPSAARVGGHDPEPGQEHADEPPQVAARSGTSPASEGPAAARRSSQGSTASQGSLRVQTGQLDMLMNLVGELVLTRNHLLQSTAESADPDTLTTTHKLNQITTALQEEVMRLRMQPIGRIWGKLPRIVRDISRSLGKQVSVELLGNDTELDKSLLEAITDPLTHLVRNSIDHGIEEPGERELNGKPAEGKLTLEAYHESGRVNIEVRDDGRGLDIESIRRRAVESGLISASHAADMTEAQVALLLFEPGFSTAEEVSSVSGRGVGLDVVKTNIERIGGLVELRSQAGRGTTVRIQIPLTLAIISALIVRCGGERYVIPQASLVELVRLEGRAVEEEIETIHHSSVYRLRGRLLPLVYLSAELGNDTGGHGGGDGDETRNIVVVQVDGQQLGLVVDEIDDTEEIVVKPLDMQLKGHPILAGTTIMGDGTVALILDVLGLAQRARALDPEHTAEPDLEERDSAPATPPEGFLLFEVQPGRRTALALDSVHRLEEIPREHLEQSGSMSVVQYQGQIMPLVFVREVFGAESRVGVDAVLQVVVHERPEGCIGLVVGTITDIVQESVPARRTSTEPDVRESVVLSGEVTDVLDVDWIISQAFGTCIPRLEGTSGRSTRPERVRDLHKVCTIYLDGHMFGIEVEKVREVLRYQAMTTVPLTPPEVSGVINLRGQTITTLDLRTSLGLTPRDAEQEAGQEGLPMNVVLMTEDGTVSVLVDDIGDVIELDRNESEPVPATVDTHLRRLIRGVHQLPEDLLLLLDIDRAVQVTEFSCT